MVAMSRRRGESGPTVAVQIGGDFDFAVQVCVDLAAGERICAARDPIWITEGVTCAVVPGGARWQADDGGTLSFGTGSGANIRALSTSESPWVVATDLVLLWTPEVRFDPLPWPSAPRFARASGEGRVWLLVPGYPVLPGYRLQGQYQAGPPKSAVAADPAQLVFVKGADALVPAAGPRGEQWVRLAPDADALLQSWDRPREVPPGHLTAPQ
jgi:hypothetical protein